MRASQYYWETGDARAADEHFKRAIALNPSDPLVLGMSGGAAVLRDQCLGLVYHAIGHAAAADAALARLIALAETPDSDATVKVSIAEVYAFRGDGDEAFKWLEPAYRQARNDRAVMPGWWTRQGCTSLRSSSPLHADPR